MPAAGDTARFSTDAAISSAWTLPGNLTISVDKDKTLDLTGVIAGAADARLTLTSAATDGSGTVNFRASNTFAGNLEILRGQVYGFGENPFGVAEDDTPMIDLKASDKFTKLYLRDVTSLKRIHQWCDDKAANYQPTLLFDGDNTIGRYETSSTTRSNVRSGRTVVTRGLSNSGLWIPFIDKTASLVIANVPADRIQYYGEGGPGPLVFACAGNKFFAGYQVAMPYRCDVNGALDPSANLAYGSDNGNCTNPMLDLNGTTQTVSRLYSKKKHTYDGTVTSAEPGLVTVTDTQDFDNRMVFAGRASLELALAEGRTATLYGQSTSSGELILTSGSAVIAAGGHWSGDVRIRSGAAVRLTTIGELDAQAVLHLEGGTLEVPAGTMIVRGIVDSEGRVHTSGVFAATAKDGATALPGLAGEGLIEVISGEPEAEAIWTWTGAAGDTRASNPGNWVDAGGVAGTAERGIDLTARGNQLHFPAAATVTLDAPVSAGGLFFDGAGEGAVTIEKTDDGYPLSLFGGAFVVTNETGTAKTVVFNAPFRYQGTVGVSVQAAAKLEFRGALSTIGAADFVKRDSGEVFVRGDANLLTGTFVNSNGTLRVTGNDPFGPNCTVYNYQKDGDARTRVVLSNARVTGAFVNHAYGNYGNGQTCLYGAADTTNVVLGRIRNVNGHFRFRSEKNAELTLAGGVLPGNLLIPQGDDWSVTRIDTTPISVNNQLYYDFNQWCICALAVTNNVFNPTMLITATLRTEVDGAVRNDMRFRFAKERGRVDLWGTTQHVDNASIEHAVMNAAGVVTKLTCETTASNGGRDDLCAGTIKSDRPGAYIAFVGDSTYPRTPVFGGAVSFERGGTGTNVIYEANSATGEVFVTGGALRFAAPGAAWMYNGVVQTYKSTGGAWAGLGATVTGGTLALDHGAAFSKDVDIRLGGGELALAEGVVQRANSLWFLVDGEWVKQKSGTWGALDNGGVSPDRRTALITGGGVLAVKETGTLLIVR